LNPPSRPPKAGLIIFSTKKVRKVTFAGAGVGALIEEPQDIVGVSCFGPASHVPATARTSVN
jgi:hypothetical protein